MHFCILYMRKTTFTALASKHIDSDMNPSKYQFNRMWSVFIGAALLAACQSAPPSLPSESAASKPNAAGHWVSGCSPSSSTQGAVLDFDIGAVNWAIDYTVFGDQTCTTKFLAVRIEGTYTIGDKSSVPGAYDARFGFARKMVTPHMDAAAQFLTSAAGCAQAGFTTGVAKDISGTGCANLGQRPISSCAADYDLVKVDANQITFGDRPADNDMCTEAKRPKALSKNAVPRK
jgi:hypothetical protein